VNSINSAITNGTYGLAALEALLTNGTYGLAALQTLSSDIQGTGFVSSTDSLHAISVFLSANIYTGGRAF
jgi:hypothetical protein